MSELKREIDIIYDYLENSKVSLPELICMMEQIKFEQFNDLLNNGPEDDED
jgi:hypothetical protein